MSLYRAVNFFCITTFCLVLTSNACAQPADKPYHMDVGITPVKVASENLNASPLGLRVVFGKKVDSNLTIEGMYVTTASRDESKNQDMNVNVGISSYGFYLKSTLTNIKKIQVFGRIGYARTRFKTTEHSGQFDREVEGISYGIGLQNFLNESWYIQSGYTVFPKKDGLSAKGFGLSVGYVF